MRKKIVAGNWKMNKNLSEGIDLANELSEILTSSSTDVEVILGVPFTHLYNCLLYTSPSPRDGLLSRMPSSA